MAADINNASELYWINRWTDRLMTVESRFDPTRIKMKAAVASMCSLRNDPVLLILNRYHGVSLLLLFKCEIEHENWEIWKYKVCFWFE